MKKISIVWCTAVLVAATVACSQETPAGPSASAATPAAAAAAATAAAPASTGNLATQDLSGTTLTIPIPSTPNDGQSFKFAEQPLTLVAKNAITTGTTPLTYTFQVANDAAFTSMAFSQDNIAQGADGSTRVVLSKLPGPLAKTYFWRVRASSGSIAGLFAPARTFSVGPEVVLGAPVLASPGSGATVSGSAILTTNNVQRSGPVTAITYRFDLSDSASFGRILFTATVPEQAGPSTQVTVQTASPLGAGQYFWRVQAFDNASTVSSPVSTFSAFTYTPFSLSQATIVSSPYDFANWAETAKITSVVFTRDYFAVDFDRRLGPNRWPDVTPPGWDGSLEYTLGMCINKNDHWYCSAVVQFWHERELSASAPPSHVGFEWFYDGARWGPMQGYQPQDGETVGIFVCAGDCRNNDGGTGSRVKERSNVAFVEWSNGGGVSYTFNSGSRTLSSQRR
jgi:hypothetical protein